MDEFDLTVFNELVDEFLQTNDSIPFEQDTSLEISRESNKETIREELIRLLSSTNPELLNPPPTEYDIDSCVDYLLRCENRRKFYFFRTVVYSGMYRFPEGSRYFIVHEHCRHRRPILQSSPNHPGVPSIYTSMWWPQFNGVYRNAIGEILHNIEREQPPLIEPMCGSFITKERRIGEWQHELKKYREFVQNDAWVTPRPEVMPITQGWKFMHGELKVE